MNLIETLRNKKIFIDIKDSKLKKKVESLLSKANAKVVKDGEYDYRITDSGKTSPKDISTGNIISLGFIKSLRTLDSIGIHKDIYLLFSRPIFKSDYDKMFLFLFFTVISLMPLVTFPIPPDDLLRHMVAYKYNFDYSKLFINTKMPSWDFYLLFDFITGQIHSLFSRLPIEKDLIRQIMPLVFVHYIFILIAFYAVKVNVRKVPNTYLIFFFSLFLLATGGRVFLERPSVLATLLFFISLGLFLQKREKLALFFTFLISIFYYLFIIYLIPLIFFSRKVLFVVLIGCIYWSLIAYAYGGNYFADIYNYIFSLDNSGITAGENKSLAYIILNTPFLMLLSIIILYYKNTNKKYLYTSTWFFLSNQIRYLENIGPLFLFSLQNIFLKLLNIFMKKNYFLIFLLSISIYLTVYNSIYNNGKTKILDKNFCKIIEGHKVKTILGMNFSVAYFCDNVKLNPAMEIRWSYDLDIEEDLLKNRIDCNEKKLKKYDYLYEDLLIGQYECLEFKYKTKEGTLWKIKKEDENK